MRVDFDFQISISFRMKISKHENAITEIPKENCEKIFHISKFLTK